MYEGKKLGRDSLSFYELLTAPAAKVLNRWFESEPLKATLSTDSSIGAMMSPYSSGSGYNIIRLLTFTVDIKHKNMINRKDRYDREITTILTHTC